MTTSPSRPNIILFMTDDQGWGDLGCYGHPHIQTPHLDHFAREGMLLTDCHASSTVCSPSRAGMLTGRTPYRNGMYTIYMPGRPFPYLRTDERTLPAILKEHGYATCHVGKWHLGHLDNPEHPRPDQHGYDHWFGTTNNASPSHINPTNFIRNGEKVGEIVGNSAGIIVDEAIKWLESKNPGQPFFITVWTHEPHTPIGTNPEFSNLYNEQLPEKLRNYYGNITQIDAAFGTLMAHLDANYLTENTFVLFTSDNGPAWDPELTQLGSTGGHRGGKAWMYEGGHRVPGLVRWPNAIPAGSVSHQPITGNDYFPTLLTALDIPLPEDRTLDGIDVLPILKGDTDTVKQRAMYWRYDGSDNDLKIAYREGDYILLADHIIDRCEMYNLATDWQQRENLVYQEFDRFAEMKERLLEHHRAVEADGPDWWKQDPDPLIPWRQNNAIGIRRFLVGELPPERVAPYAELPTR